MFSQWVRGVNRTKIKGPAAYPVAAGSFGNVMCRYFYLRSKQETGKVKEKKKNLSQSKSTSNLVNYNKYYGAFHWTSQQKILNIPIRIFK